MDLTDVLRGTPIFHNVDSLDLWAIADIAVEHNFGEGQLVFSQGDVADSLYVIESGSVRVLKKGREGNEEVARLNKGQHFGEMALIEEECRSATVESAEKTRLIQIEREALDNLLKEHPSLARQVYKAFAKHLSGRLRQTTKDLTSLIDLSKELRKFNYFPESW
jgi:CRP-like cAMP-binding protein